MLVEIFCVDSSFPVQIVTRFMKAEVSSFSLEQICIRPNLRSKEALYTDLMKITPAKNVLRSIVMVEKWSNL